MARPMTSAILSTWRVLDARTRHSVMRPLLNAAPHRPATAAGRMVQIFGAECCNFPASPHSVALALCTRAQRRAQDN